MKQELLEALKKTLSGLSLDTTGLKLDYPENPEHGDFSTNIALAQAKKAGMAPRALAEKIVEAFKKDQPDLVASISIAGAGFINFSIKDSVFAEEVVTISKDKEYGWGTTDKGKKIMVEYTDPNPFKVFHIGHLMSNAIGESISRLIQTQAADVIRACYQGDVGLHVAKTINAILAREGIEEGVNSFPKDSDSLDLKIEYLGRMYVIGNSDFDNDDLVKKNVYELNKKIFEGKIEGRLKDIYVKGRDWSLQYFAAIYNRLGTTFNNNFYESEFTVFGLNIVREFLEKGVFKESEGAVIFKGEDYALHTRVFITSQNIPTYEAKELGLNTKKFQLYPDLSESIIITANEQSDYFKVLLKVFSLIDKRIAEGTKHISHGIMRFTSGKMSSREGNIVAAEDLINDIKKMVKEKIVGRELAANEADEIADTIAIGAIKYTILRQAIGGDVIFDSAASISFEGDSGPYLQYSAVRAAAVLKKAEEEKLSPYNPTTLPPSVGLLEKLITRFPDIIERARNEYAPQHVANYLIALAGAFNSFYAAQMIVDKNDPNSPYYVALTQAFLTVMTNGLRVLGIKVPKKM